MFLGPEHVIFFKVRLALRKKSKPQQDTKPAHARYKTTLLPPDVRNALGKVYVAGLDLGLERKMLRRLFSMTGHDLPKPTLRNWELSLRPGNLPVDVSTHEHPRPALTSEQVNHLVGFVIHKNFNREQVYIEEARDWLSTRFGINLLTLRSGGIYTTNKSHLKR